MKIYKYSDNTGSLKSLILQLQGNLNDSTKKLEYSMDNLKEFRVVKVSEFYKRFSEGMQNNEK